MNWQQSKRQYGLIATNSLRQSALTWLLVPDPMHPVKSRHKVNMAVCFLETNQRSLFFTAAFRLYGTTGTNYVTNQLD